MSAYRTRALPVHTSGRSYSNVSEASRRTNRAGQAPLITEPATAPMEWGKAAAVAYLALIPVCALIVAVMAIGGGQ